MSPYPCENCLVQVVCRFRCFDLFVHQVDVERELFSLHKVMYSVNGNKRKHRKMQQVKHYKSCIKKFANLNMQKMRITRRIIQNASQ
jgi:hypothetical protein